MDVDTKKFVGIPLVHMKRKLSKTELVEIETQIG
jgi:hypothetical protein